MSRIGRMPITVPAGVEVTVAEGNVVTVKGPKGTLTKQLHPTMMIEQEGNTIHVKRPDETKESKSLHGLTRTLLNNMITGVHEVYKKELEAATSRWSVSLPPRSARSVPPSLTRARASSMWTRSSAARLVRPVPRSKEAC